MPIDLQDAFNRKIVYLRLSLTERCNFACRYCLPLGYAPKADSYELTLKEISVLVKGFASLGVKKIRLTGGEPTLRKDFIDIIKTIKDTDGIKTLALTTNGFNLLQRAEEFYNNGINNINISLDSLNKDNFKAITSYSRLDKILNAVDLCLKLPFKKVKVNAVLLKEFIKKDLSLFLDYVKDKEVDVRFIELMRTSSNKEFFNEQHLTADSIKQMLLNHSWRPAAKEENSGPAILLQHKDYKGRIGFITPYSNNFCNSCNRVRVTSKGELQLCLFGLEKLSLKPYLQNEKDIKSLQHSILKALQAKPKQHYLTSGILGLDDSFSKIGG